jgi:hypothetical protein
LFLLGEDLETLEQAVTDLGDVRLVAIDPITAFMGHGKGFDSHRASDVRSQLHPLSKLAEKLGVTFSAVTHPPKGAASRAAVDNYIGSQAFLAAARVGHYCIAELGEEDDRGFRRPTGRVLFGVTRASHSDERRLPMLAYRIEEVSIGWDSERECEIKAPHIVWDPESIDLTIDEALTANKPAGHDGRKARAAPVREFVRDMITAGPVSRNIVVERGAEKGFSLDQLRRALERVDGVPFKRRGEELNSAWMWSFRKDVPVDAEIKEEDA